MSTLDLNPGLLFFVGTLFGIEYLRSRQKYYHYVASYWQERKGRNRVEREMRKISDIQLSTGDNGAFFVQPIARVEGCYKQVRVVVAISLLVFIVLHATTAVHRHSQTRTTGAFLPRCDSFGQEYEPGGTRWT